jgi:hypothetical protein
MKLVLRAVELWYLNAGGGSRPQHQMWAFFGVLEVQYRAIGWLWKACISLGGEMMVRFFLVLKAIWD